MSAQQLRQLRDAVEACSTPSRRRCRRSRRCPCRDRCRATCRCRRSARTAGPSGSIVLWHDAHTGVGAVLGELLAHRLAEVQRLEHRDDRGRRRRHCSGRGSGCRMNLPRRTGSVRSSFAIVASSDAWVRRPERWLGFRSHAVPVVRRRGGRRRSRPAVRVGVGVIGERTDPRTCPCRSNSMLRRNGVRLLPHVVGEQRREARVDDRVLGERRRSCRSPATARGT